MIRVLVFPFTLAVLLAFYGLVAVVVLLMWLTTLVLNQRGKYDSAARVTILIRTLIRAMNPFTWSLQPSRGR